jgi:hypothetical protein
MVDIEKKSLNIIDYQGTSPDEISLVGAAR